jgi:hypothetical protein
VDREELVSQGNLIFMEALNRYEVGRVVFGTFLKHRLRTLNDFCISEIYRCNTSVSICDEEKPVNLTDLDFDKFIRTLELLESMTVLTEDARAIIAYLLNGDWEPPVNKQVPSLRLVQNHFEEDGWERSRTKTAWYEIKYWWREQELAV